MRKKVLSISAAQPMGSNQREVSRMKGGADQKTSSDQYRPIRAAQPGVLPRTGLNQERTVNLRADISAVLELWRRRQAWHRAEKSLTLTAKGLCRRIVGGDKDAGTALYDAILKDKPHDLVEVGAFAIGPLLAAFRTVSAARKDVEKQLEGLAKKLPGYDFVTRTPGCSAFTLYSLTAECAGVNHLGFLDFATISRIYVRMSVHQLADGTRARLLSGAAAIEAGYVPSRRSVIWTIGDSLIKSQGPYRDLYLKLKEDEVRAAQEQGLTVLPSAKIPKKNAELYRSEGHIHNRAKRRMEKRLLHDLWVDIRRECGVSDNEWQTHFRQQALAVSAA